MESNNNVESHDNGERNSIVVKLIIITMIMFGFGYALVPLYEAFCRVTGFGGKTDIIEEAVAAGAVASDREVAVTFTSHSHTALPGSSSRLPRA